jgi:hypothetical protein
VLADDQPIQPALAQSERFMKAAKALGADESGEAFKRALDKLVQRKPR